MTGFKTGGVDFSTLLEPRSSTKIADVGIQEGGVDISNTYESAASGSAYGTLNYLKAGTDIGTLFAALGSLAKSLYIVGSNNLFQLGPAVNNGVSSLNSPVLLTTIKPNTASAFGQTIFYIKSSGALFAQGDNKGNVIDANTQTTVYSWSQVAGGTNNALGIRSDGLLFAWGYGFYGVLGLNDGLSRSSPTQVGTGTWSQVTIAASSAAAIDSTGKLWAWGLNSSGQLGLNDLVHRSSPVQVGAGTWSKVEKGGGGGREHTLAINSSNQLFTWGSNTNGQLGQNSVSSLSSPVQVGAGTWSNLSAGYDHSFAINSTNGLFAWGQNISFGPLGLNDVISRSSPVQVGAGTWKEISAGGSNNGMATTQTNLLFIWGSAGGGKLGLNVVINRSSPTQLGAGTWSKVAFGLSNTYGITTGGALFAWGSAGVGLGQNNPYSTIDYSSPVQVGASTTWTAVSGKASAVMCISSNKLYTFGNNNYGQLGIIAPSAAGITSTGSPTLVGGQKANALNSPLQIGSYSWTQISNGTSHNLAIRNDGLLFAWGSNINGQLGLGNYLYTSSPTQIGTGSWTNVSAGGDNSAAIRSDGLLFIWGNNTDGKILNSTTTAYSWTQVAVGFTHGLAIRSDGLLFSWGNNQYGQLAVNDNFDSASYLSSPVQIGSTNTWTSIDAGGNGSAAIRSDGSLWMWGLNQYGSLGLNDLVARSSPTQVGSQSWTQVRLGASSSGNDYLTVAIRNNGLLFAWGGNTYGALGLNDTVDRSSPVQVGAGTWSKVACDRLQVFAITSANTLFSWGNNGSGTLGLNDLVTRSSPVQVGAGTWSSISANSNNVLAITSANTLFSWGTNGSGALGLNNTVARSSPVQVGAGTWSKVAAGTRCLAINSSNQLFTMGVNSSGQLGLNDTVARSSPVQVGAGTWSSISVYDIDGTQWKSDAIDSSGRWWSWGYFQYLNNVNSNLTYSSPVQVGSNSNVPINSPVQVGVGTWSSVSTGTSHYAAINSSNTLFTWGSNPNGQLGLNNYVTRSSPVQVGAGTWSSVKAGTNGTIAINASNLLFIWGNTNSPGNLTTVYSWSQISAGSTTVAIRSEGSLWTWGGNNNGQLGLGDVIARSSPTQVGSNSWTLITSSGNGSAAIRSDNTLWVWGQNSTQGQLGLNDIINRSSPTQVGTGNWSQVNTSGSHMAAVNASGLLFTWGSNNIGQLGLSDRINRSSPVQVGASTWSKVSAGLSNTFAITSTNTLFSWGNNTAGQLGLNNNSTVHRSSPVQVGAATWNTATVDSTNAVGIRASNLLFTWGSNTGGTLGLNEGLIAIKSSPVQVGAGTWSAAITRSSSVYGITSAGALFAWGSNNTGALGLNNVILRSSPVQVGAGTNWSKIDFRVATTSTGQLFTWSVNDAGQAGLFDRIARSSPVQVGGQLVVGSLSPIQVGAGTWSKVAIGDNHAGAISSNNSLFTWGLNSSGQLGLNDNVTRSSPVQVGATGAWGNLVMAGNNSLFQAI